MATKPTHPIKADLVVGKPLAQESITITETPQCNCSRCPNRCKDKRR